MKDKLLTVIADILEMDADEINTDAVLSTIPQWDSVAQMQIIGEIEDVFAIEIPIERIPDIKKIQDFIDLVC